MSRKKKLSKDVDAGDSRPSPGPARSSMQPKLARKPTWPEDDSKGSGYSPELRCTQQMAKASDTG